MAGSLIKIAETTVSSATASVDLTGIDSTYDVYMVSFNNALPSVDSQLSARVLESGTANSTANYDYAAKNLSTSGFENKSGTNGTSWSQLTTTQDNAVGNANGVFYLYNFNNSSEYSFLTYEEAHIQASSNTLRGVQGGGVFTSNSSCNGIRIFFLSGNIVSGTFTLYGLKK